MPDGGGKLAGDGDGGLVATAASGDGKAPFLERVIHLEQAFARLDEQGAQGTFAVALESAASVIVAALQDTRVEPEIRHQFLRVSEASNIPDRST